MASTIGNVLYVTSDGAYLRRDGEAVVVEVEQVRRAVLPLAHLGGVICFGRARVSNELLGALWERGIAVAYFGHNGRFLARVEGIPGGSVYLRRAQYRASDDPQRALSLARAFVLGKLASARAQLRRRSREVDDGAAKERLDAAARAVDAMLGKASGVADLDELRGCEGAGAEAYFQVFQDHLLGGGFVFSTRSRRPPKDPVNAMLSFGYALLYADCAGALTAVGLDPAVGFLHADRPGRLSLALDLMEELRTPVVDRLVTALVNRKQVKTTHFHDEHEAGCRMTDEGRKLFLAAYQEAKGEELTHVFLEQRTSWGTVPHLQARLLARTLRGDLEVYPPLVVR